MYSKVARTVSANGGDRLVPSGRTGRPHEVGAVWPATAPRSISKGSLHHPDR
jgi:hypothetical protein